MSQTFDQVAGTIPVPTSLEFKPWLLSLIEARSRLNPVVRVNSLYVATAGSDGNPGTQASPFATIAQALSVATANTTIYLNRGDTFNTPITINNISNLSIASYGSGDKPRISAFVRQYPAGTSWTNLSGNVYYLTETNAISWARIKHDVLNPLTKVTTTTDCQTVAGSWFWDTGTNRLYVHAFAGEDPTTGGLDYEAATIAESANNGALIEGTSDLVRFDSLIFEGWGINYTTTPSKWGISAALQGLQEFCASNCGTFYCGIHAFGLNGDSGYSVTTAGGIATFINHRYGWTYNSASQGNSQAMMSYAALGGQETIFHRCEAVGGGLPFGTAAGPNDTAGYASTGTGSPSLIVFNECTVKSHKYQYTVPPYTAYASTPTFVSDITSCVAFVVDDTFEPSPGGYDTLGVVGALGFAGNTNPWMIIINPNYHFKINSAGNVSNAASFNKDFTGGSPFAGLVLNGRIIWEFPNLITNGANANFLGVLASSYGTSAALKFYNCYLNLRINSTKSITAGFGQGASVGGTASTLSQCEMHNSMWVVENQSNATWSSYLAMYNNAANLSHNAYVGLNDGSRSASAGTAEGYDADVNAVVMDAVAMGTPDPASPLYGGGKALVQPGNHVLEYDCNYNQRLLRSIGPWEESQETAI
jgi:hypothetical protein